jgi:hypothetical protein
MPGSTGGGWKRSDLATVTGVAQPTGKPAENRPQALPSGTATAPALDPTNLNKPQDAAVGSRLRSGPPARGGRRLLRLLDAQNNYSGTRGRQSQLSNSAAPNGGYLRAGREQRQSLR